MLTFLRKFRKSLIEAGSFRHYLLYAIGEIALVMIGILLALQVNNWNQDRKDSKMETFYLNDIKDDLQNDTTELNRIITANYRALSRYKHLDPDFYLLEVMRISIDETKIDYRRLFDRGRSYRPARGSYSSLISGGQTNLIHNRKLFSLLQDIYEVEYAHIASLYETIKDVETDLKKKRAFEIKYPPSKYINDIGDKAILADLSYFHDEKYHYTSILINQRERILRAIQLIEEEIDK